MPKYGNNVYVTIAAIVATIQQNMYKYANTRKKRKCLDWECLGNAETETDVIDARRRKRETTYAAVKT